jgi:hypothetical protein
MMWALGEAAGAVVGTKRAGRALEATEIKPVTAADVARADAWAEAHS